VGRSREAGAHTVELNRWFEIVGIVQDFPAHALHDDGSDARLYHAAAAGDMDPALVAVRVHGGDPARFANRFRQIAVAVDPRLQLRGLATFADTLKREQGIWRLIGVTVTAVMGAVIVLSAAGIYALMSFTVARRRKEIGIRAALGADPARILAGIFSRAFRQLAMGAAAGMIGAIALEQLLEGEMFQGHGAVILPLVAVLMTVVGLLAAVGPARRGLRVDPTAALREE
jgi:ABC-type antimicrobial peptide transport system permease subunit